MRTNIDNLKVQMERFAKENHVRGLIYLNTLCSYSFSLGCLTLMRGEEELFFSFNDIVEVDIGPNSFILTYKDGRSFAFQVMFNLPFHPMVVRGLDSDLLEFIIDVNFGKVRNTSFENGRVFYDEEEGKYFELSNIILIKNKKYYEVQEEVGGHTRYLFYEH